MVGAVAEPEQGGFDPGRPSAPARRRAAASVEEMLAPDALTQVLGRPVRSVERRPFTPTVWFSSGSVFEGIHLDSEVVPSLVMKTPDPDRDWGAITFDDRVDREIRVWETGLLDRLPPPAAASTRWKAASAAR